MTKDWFEIAVDKIRWLADESEEWDICAHGCVYVKIGDEVIAGGDTEWCVSASALHLLRTLASNHTKANPVGEQLIPCCGHLLIADTDNDDVCIGCCPSGIDWEVKHRDHYVKLTTVSGTEAIISYNIYKEAVYTFADKVEAFYRISLSKEFEDDFERRSYEKFWGEWDRRRSN